MKIPKIVVNIAVGIGNCLSGGSANGGGPGGPRKSFIDHFIPEDSKSGDNWLQGLCICTMMFGLFGLLAASIYKQVGLLAISLVILTYSAILWREALRRMRRDVRDIKAKAACNLHLRRRLLVIPVLLFEVPVCSLVLYSETEWDFRICAGCALGLVILTMVLLMKLPYFSWAQPDAPRYKLKNRA